MADSKAGYQTWENVWYSAPNWFREKLRRLAKESGMVPDPVGYDADGNPVYALKDVAKRMGTNEEELIKQNPHMATTTKPFHRIN